ncbi:MAG: ribosome small subunit-dependent GTPase A [Bacilli bacterium]|nr:ribosome small subunit-dependent GTPase A [Bacilli bacterium]
MKGTIVKQISNLYTVNVKDVLYECRARGKFYYAKIAPLVGDHVIIDPEKKYILDILPRNNYLNRPSIANIDICIIVTSVKEPNLDLNLLDKLLCIIIHNKIKPIICFTKVDLLNLQEKNELQIIINYYTKIDIKTFINTETNKIIKEISNNIVVLTGQTGAGKSTFLNKIDQNLNLDTNPISKSLGRGVHTTRHVELFKYKTSFIADTPGFSALDINELTKEEIKNTYPEFKVGCKFKDCNHIKENNCKVKELVEKGIILESRYYNYLKFMR